MSGALEKGITDIDLRTKEIETFLNKVGFSGNDRTEMPSDASFRKYMKLKKGDADYVLMDSPIEHYNLEPFLLMAEYLRSKGFSAPKIFNCDKERGLLILEYLGNCSIKNACTLNGLEFEDQIYRLIIDLLIQMQNNEPPSHLEVYSDELLIEESLLFIDWYIPILLGENISLSLRNEYIDIFAKILKLAKLEYNVLVHRDYHAENLMYIEDKEGINQVGLLDFQDALIGPTAYDLVSLLEDARRDIRPELATEMINYYLGFFPTVNRKEFLASYYILGAQRNLRILGVFARKLSGDRNSNYLPYITRVKNYLNKDLQHPLLAPLNNWSKKILP